MRVIFTNIFKTLFAILFFLIPAIEGRSQGPYVSNNVSIGGGGFVTGIVTHPTSGDRYCRTDVGGAYRWDAANNKWIQLLDWLSDAQGSYSGVESIAIDPQNPSTIYMLCGIAYMNSGATAILKSVDKGNTFTVTDVTSKFKAHGNGKGRGNGERLAVDPKNSNILFSGTRENGLWKSTDAGATWNLAWSGVTTTSSTNGICFVLFDPLGSVVNGASQTIYIGVSRSGAANIYKSTDGGASFADISATTSFMPHRAALQGTTMYVTYSDSEGPTSSGGLGKVYKLNTSTGAWTNVTPTAWQDFAYGGVSIDPNNVDRVIVSSCGLYQNNQFGNGWGDFIYLSTDGGSTWTLKNGKNATYNSNGMAWAEGGVNWMDCIEFDQSNTSIVRVIGGGGVYTCMDITATNPSWKYDVIGIEETAFLDGISIPGGPLISSFGDVTGFVHDPLTSFPTKKLSPSDPNNQSIAYAGGNPSRVVRASNGGNVVYYSNNMGASWTACPTNKGTDGRVSISADGGTILHCPKNSTTTYYTTNNGASWSSCSGVSLASAIPVADPVNSNVFYIYNPNGQMLKSSDKGVSFSVAGTPGATSTPWNATVIRTVPGYEGHLWIPLVDNGLRYSTDQGATYTTVANVTHCKAIGIGKALTPTSYPAIYIWGTVGGVRGLFRSTDKGVSWIKINDNAHQYGGAAIVLGDINVFGRVYLGTESARGIVYWEDLTKYTISTTALPSPGGVVNGAGTYAIGTTVTLTAAPAPGYIFTGWSGDAAGTAASVAVDMTGNKTVTANFQLQKYTLTATASPLAGGSVSGAGSYDAGSVATLTATPAEGYTFTGWSGDATGSTSSITVNMNGNKTVTANFQLQKYTLTATASPSEGGSISGTGTYDAGTTATVTAVPSTGYIFTGWSGDASGTATSATVDMNGNKTVTANFQSQKYTLAATALPSEGGSISGAGSYDAGSIATLTATPAEGYTFTGWSGDVSGFTPSLSITMDGDKTVIANFQVESNTIKYTLNATPSPVIGGTISGAGSYDEGTVVTITATPASGYIFTGWSGDITGTANSITLTINSDITVQGNFQESIAGAALKIPKLFSPDNHGDLSTELWNIENAYLLDGCEMEVYNRQGQKVYSCFGYATPWDGTSNGKALPDGAYFYIIRYPDNKKQTGSVTIARIK